MWASGTVWSRIQLYLSAILSVFVSSGGWFYSQAVFSQACKMVVTPVNQCPCSHLRRGKAWLPGVISLEQKSSLPEAPINLSLGCVDPCWPMLPINEPIVKNEVTVDHNPPTLTSWMANGSGPLPEMSLSLHPYSVTSQLCDFLPMTQPLWTSVSSSEMEIIMLPVHRVLRSIKWVLDVQYPAQSDKTFHNQQLADKGLNDSSFWLLFAQLRGTIYVDYTCDSDLWNCTAWQICEMLSKEFLKWPSPLG